MQILGTIAWWLVVVGALNWGLVAVGFNLVYAIFGTIPTLETVVYALVGISAIYLVLQKFEIV